MKLAVLPDFVEEGWLSMEYCAERLLAELPGAVRVCPPYRRIATRFAANRKAVNADRVFNRYLRYPRFVRRIRGDYDCFHIVDHSYAHLARGLPGGRTGVYCHDVDAFRGVFEPGRSRWFRQLGRHLLEGLRNAAVVFVNSQQTRGHLLEYQLVEASRIVLCPLGVAEEFTPGPSVYKLDGPWILHVGSCVPRKRIDVLLDAFAAARRRIPGLRLLKISGEFSPAQRGQIERLNLREAIVHEQGLSRGELAAVYRAAPLVVIPSDAEGFGLPALEAIACGAKVLASDLPALREAGGDAAIYASVAAVSAWSDLIVSAFDNPGLWPRPALREVQASRFSWGAHAQTIHAAYYHLWKPS